MVTTSHPANIVLLGEPASLDPGVVGGKAAAQSRLKHRGYRVPDGFVLPTSLMRQSQSPRLHDAIQEGICHLMARNAWADFAAAVRSSGIDEDGAAASFAGQYESFLNVTGAEAILQAVEQSRDSAFSQRAGRYRRQQGKAPEAAPLAVLVQQFVAADVSAVVFSANPVSGRTDEILINASWGLGESIVGGTVSPDLFIIGKPELRLASSNIADKRQMTIPVPGGTEEVKVPRFLRHKASLTEAEAMQMAQLAMRLEVEMGYPVDVECAWSGGSLYLLQCRPITTLRSSGPTAP